MKLNPGMYVRTPLGISKYLGNYNNVNNLHEFNKLDGELWSGDIADVVFDCEIEDVVLKANYNIIDLIEKNDIILGKDGIIYQVDNVDRGYVFTKAFNDNGEIITLVDYQIDKVLTKEQFENYCYKVVR